MAKISIRDLRHSYLAEPKREEDWALKRISLECGDGGAYALLGPSGCGKTTLLNLISGLLQPTEGRIFFDDSDVTEAISEKRNIAQVFQFPVIYDTMSVYDNLAFPLRNRGMQAAKVDARVKEVAAMLDLTPYLSRGARRLTADMKQKISLGRGLVRPDVGAILFDEPLTVIDPHMKWQLRAQLKRVQEQSNATMIYVTHDQTEALTFARQVIVMYEGEIVQTGTPQELFERPAHTFVGYFIGSPGMNVLPASIDNGNLIIKGNRIALARPLGDIPQGAVIEAGIRPEFISLLKAGRGGIPVTVKRVEDTGRFKIARIELEGLPLSVVASEDAPIDAGAASIVFDPQHLHIYAQGHLVGGDR